MGTNDHINLKGYIEAYTTYYPYFINIVRSKVKNIDEADDICQELFIQFYKAFADIDAGSHKSWLFTAMRFITRSYYRNKSTRNIDAVDIDDYIDNTELSFVNGERDNRIILKEELDEESGNFETPEDKVLFDLITVYAYTYNEAAKIFSVSQRQVIYRYKKTTERNMSYLKKKGFKDIDEFYE